MFTEQKIYTMKRNYFAFSYWQSSNENQLISILGVGHPLAFQSRRLKNAILTQNKLFKNLHHYFYRTSVPSETALLKNIQLDLHHYFYRTVCTIWNWPIEDIQLAILDIWNYPEHQSIIFLYCWKHSGVCELQFFNLYFWTLYSKARKVCTTSLRKVVIEKSQ